MGELHIDGRVIEIDDEVEELVQRVVEKARQAGARGFAMEVAKCEGDGGHIVMLIEERFPTLFEEYEELKKDGGVD